VSEKAYMVSKKGSLQMKAAICREFGQPLVIEDVTLAPVSIGQVHVKVAACAICHSDIMAASGAWGGHLPAVYGHEAAGTVLSVGAGVDDVSVGDAVLVTLIRACGTCPTCEGGHPTSCETPYDRVASSPLTDNSGTPLEHGMQTAAFAQEVVVDQSQVIGLPSTLAMDAASLLACGAITGIGAVTNSAQMPKGASAVVIGAGGVGLNTIQGAVLSGASHVIALDVEDSKLDGALEFGATHAVNALAKDAVDQVRNITGGQGANYVFVTVGAIAAYRSALDYLAPRGELVMVGMTAVGDEMGIEPVNIAAASQVLRGSNMGDTVLQRDIPALIEHYQAGRLKLDELITNRYSLDQINEAIEDTKAGQSRRNVIIF
jgi:Zn-dependent alcohol dehydrogenase